VVDERVILIWLNFDPVRLRQAIYFRSEKNQDSIQGSAQLKLYRYVDSDAAGKGETSWS